VGRRKKPREKRMGAQLGIRVPRELAEILRRVSRDRGEDISDFVRRAILRELARLGFLSEEQKKALGIPM